MPGMFNHSAALVQFVKKILCCEVKVRYGDEPVGVTLTDLSLSYYHRVMQKKRTVPV